MKKMFAFAVVLSLLAACHALLATARAQGTAFTYQGRLSDGASPANGSYDLRLSLFTTNTGGSAAFGPLTNSATFVSNGLFTVTLDFGAGPWDGTAYWLQIGVRSNATGAFLTTTPRQALTPTPYAINSATAASATTATTATNFSGPLSGGVTGTQVATVVSTVGGVTAANVASGANAANAATSADTASTIVKRDASGNFAAGTITAGSFAGNGANVTSVTAATLNGLKATNFWQTGGNAGTTPGADFLGNVDNKPLEIQMNGSVGIDTATPETRLHVAGASGAAVRVTGGAGGGSTVAYDLSTYDPATNPPTAQIRATDDGVWSSALDFLTKNPGAPTNALVSRLHISSATGNIGIGTTNPAAPLEVAGNIIAHGTFTGNGGGLTNLNAAQLTGFSYATPPASGAPILNMIWIVPGTFIMGSTTNDPDADPLEMPQTVVTLTNGFWMGQHPVTQGEYLAAIGSNPSYFAGDLSRPIEKVTWYDATNFCYLLTQREQSAGRLPAGWVYRLPMEAEWEYCCRALTTTRFYFGNNPGDTASVTNYAWYYANTGGSSTQPVGQLLPNAWGLVDMAGNVLEWCQDWAGSYPGGSTTNPQGPATGINRVLRGSVFDGPAANCRSAQRGYGNPAHSDLVTGFRVVLAPGQ
jgi:formylglycine-generating enzyme required for sulfatase activity